MRDGILIEVEKGARKHATRFRFNLPESSPAGDTNATAPPNIASCNAREQHPPPAADSKSNPASAPAPRKLTTCELVERKKALQDLIKGLGHEGFWEAEDRKRCKQLKKELANVNIRLAGVGE